MSSNRVIIALGTGLMMLLGSFGGLLGNAAADVTGNDDFSTAEPITTGTISGTVSRPNDPIDYYSVDVELGKYLIFNFTAAENWEVIVTIYYYVNYEYETQATSGSMKLAPVSWEQRISRVLGYVDPTFYISIESKTGTTSYDIRIEKYDFPEGSWENLTKIPDKTYSGVFALYTKYNYFGADMKDAQLIKGTVTVDDTPDSSGLDMTLHQSYSNERDVIESINIIPGSSRTIEFQTSTNTSGRYYFELFGTNCNYSYTLSIIPQNDSGSGGDAPDIFNETLNDTLRLPGTGLYSGSVRDDDATDWYSFEVARGQIIDYQISTGTSDSGSVKFQLFNKDKALVNATPPLVPKTSEKGRRVTNNLGAGLWYIDISGGNDYTLDLKLTDQVDGGAIGDAGDTLDQARQVVPKAYYDGLLGDNDTVDFYSFLAIADNSYKVNIVMTSGDGVLNGTLYEPDMQPVDQTEDVPFGANTTLEFAPLQQELLYLAVASSGAAYSFDIVAPADAALPSITVTSPANGSVLSGPTFDMEGTASDSTGLLKVEISLSGIEWTPAEGTESWTYSGLTVGEGISTVWARATDLLGNIGITWIVLAYIPGGLNDTEAPQVNITSPSNGAMLPSATFALTGTATDDFQVFKVEVSLSGIVWWPASGTTNWTYPGLKVGEGISTIYVRATDFSEKSGTASIQVGYAPGGSGDTAPPQIAIVAPANYTMLASATFDVAGTASDDFTVVKVEVSLNGIAWLAASGTTNWTCPGLTVGEGISTVWARATDFSGNTAIAWILVGYRAGGAGDAQKPQIAITSPGNGTLVGAKTFDVTGTASDDFTVTKVELSQNGIAWLPANGTSSWSYTGLAVGDGISTIWARATDFSGNINITWILVGYRSSGAADAKKPVVSVSSPSNGSVVTAATINVTGTASDDFGVFKVELSLSGIDWWLAGGTTTWTYSRLTIGEGGNTIWARATDFAGNTNTTSVLVTFVPGGDTVKPIITLTSLKDKAKVSKGKLAILGGTASDNVAVKKLTLKVNDVEVTVTYAGGLWTATNVTLQEGKNTIVVTATDSSGNVQTATFTVTYEKAKAQPGFELLLLVMAVGIGLATLGRRRK
jgi:hypothetical protein